MDSDYKRFCLKCGWLDEDYGCTCPSAQEVYQCPMYMYYHPEAVEAFNRSMEEWARKEKAKISITFTMDDLKLAFMSRTNYFIFLKTLAQKISDEDVKEILLDYINSAEKATD